jgi:hypothetical protein
MADTQAFLRLSQQRVIEGYRRVLATWPEMPAHERAAIVSRLRAAEEQLAVLEGGLPGSWAARRIAAE